VVTADVLVLDRIAFTSPDDNVPVLRGMIGRGVLEHLGSFGTVLFLPPGDAALWEQAVGARRARRFVVASADLVLPPFPLGGIVGG
jgi:hypothetical protein